MSSFPNVIYGAYGDEKKSYSAAPGGMPLGQKMVLPDGRTFRLARCSTATALTAGVVVSSSAGVVGHGAIAGSGLLASATTTHNVVGAVDVRITSKSVAFTKDEYAGGYMNVQLSAGNAHLYKIKGNDSAAVSSLCKFELERTDPLKVAFAAGSTAISLRKPPYNDCIAFSRSALVAGAPVGVTPVAVSTSYFFWAQRSGYASIRTSGSVCVVGQIVECDTVTSGSVTVALSTNNSTRVDQAGAVLGFALEAPSAAEATLVDLILER